MYAGKAPKVQHTMIH